MENNESANETVQAQFGETTENLEGAFAEKQADEATQPENVETEAEEVEDVDFSKKFAALSRKEKDLRSRESEYDSKMAELQAKIDAMEAEKNAEPEVEPELPLEYRLKRNPLKTLEELGYDLNSITEMALNDGQLSPERRMELMKEDIENDYKKKYEQLEERLNEKEKQEEEKKYEATINNFKNEIKEFVSADSEAYELIQANDATELIYDVIEEHHKDTSRILGMKEAADAVESFLEEEAKKFLNLKKFSKLQGSNEETEEPTTERQSPITLSNDHSAASQNKADKKLSREESIAQAASMIKWNS